MPPALSTRTTTSSSSPAVARTADISRRNESTALAVRSPSKFNTNTLRRVSPDRFLRALASSLRCFLTRERDIAASSIARRMSWSSSLMRTTWIWPIGGGRMDRCAAAPAIADMTIRNATTMVAVLARNPR